MSSIKIIYQHPDFWVVVKPEGESFHSEAGVGFAQRLQNAFPEQAFYPLHRLDKMTSGVMVFATNKVAAAQFGDMFADHRFEKRYLAVSLSKPKKKQGTIAGSMQVSRRGQWKLSSQGDNLAVTQFFSAALDGRRYFFVRPLTGKTHQIRVALKSLGAPILGDVRYSGGVADRGYLHAYSLAFTWQGQPYAFQVWPDQGQWFSDAAKDLYQANFFEPSLIWPKFTIPK